MSVPLFEVIDGGLQASIQDAGRPNAMRFGVPRGGAADPWAHQVANLLVGNALGDAVLEVLVGGTVLHALGATVVAVAGGDLGCEVDGRALEPNRSLAVNVGAVFAFRGGPGARAYLGVPGGFDVPVVLGSRSTALGSGFGGLEGRAVRPGDVLRAGTDRDRPPSVPAPAVWPEPPPRSESIRIVRGPHDDLVGEEVLERLLEREWDVAGSSDRMGLRFEGDPITAPMVEVASLGVAWGAIQLPPDGHPIVLLVDHQPTGGYPVPAACVAADRPVLAQLKPGATVRFTQVTRQHAIELLRQQSDAMREGAGAVREIAGWDALWHSAGS